MGGAGLRFAYKLKYTVYTLISSHLEVLIPKSTPEEGFPALFFGSASHRLYLLLLCGKVSPVDTYLSLSGNIEAHLSC